MTIKELAITLMKIAANKPNVKVTSWEGECTAFVEIVGLAFGDNGNELQLYTQWDINDGGCVPQEF